MREAPGPFPGNRGHRVWTLGRESDSLRYGSFFVVVSIRFDRNVSISYPGVSDGAGGDFSGSFSAPDRLMG